MHAVRFRSCLAVVLAVLCCSCSTPEERADAAFGKLGEAVVQLQDSLRAITNGDSAQAASLAIEAEAEALRGALTRIDELADDPELSPEARLRIGERYHEPLSIAVHATLNEVYRVMQHDFFRSESLRRIARREFAHYSTRGIHPWPYAVLKGRAYRPRPSRK